MKPVTAAHDNKQLFIHEAATLSFPNEVIKSLISVGIGSASMHID